MRYRQKRPSILFDFIMTWCGVKPKLGETIRFDCPLQFPPKKYKVITICGSTRFKEDILKAQKDLTMQGNVVLSCPFFNHADGIEMTEKDSYLVDELHKQKIDMSDAIYVVNKGGYIGESTSNEIIYAESIGKRVIFMEERKDG